MGVVSGRSRPNQQTWWESGRSQTVTTWGLIREISSYKLGLPASDLNQYKEIPVGQISFEDITTAFVKMLRIVLVQGLLVANVVLANEEKFQKCCGEEKLYSPKDRSCHLPTSQGPCKTGEWFVMARDSSGMGVCEKAPCKNNQMILGGRRMHEQVRHQPML